MIQGINNILFDLGGVLYDIEYHRVERAFARLQSGSGGEAQVVRYSLRTQPEVLTRYEIGAEVLPVDSLKFKDSKRYPARL